MTMLLLCWMALLAPELDQDPWVEILKGAQATNQAKVRQGSASVALKFTPARSSASEPLELEADVFWRDERVFERYKFLTKADYPLNRTNTIALEDAPWNYLLETSTEFCSYTTLSRILTIDRSHRRGTLASILALEPARAWFACCPPNTNDGRPWTDMLDLRITTKAGESTRTTYEKRVGGQVVQTRKDPDGFALTVTYDLEQGGNPIQVTSFPVDPQSVAMVGTYQWRQVGDAFVLDRCEFQTPAPRFPREPETYALTVRRVTLSPPAPTLFDKEELLKQLKGRIVIKDLITNRETVRNTDAGADEANFKGLSGVLKGRGFGRPR